MFVQFVLELGVLVEVDDEGAQIDEIAVAFDLEFEILLDGPTDGLGLDSADLGGLGDREPEGVLDVNFGFGAVDSFLHMGEKKVKFLSIFLVRF